MESIDNEILILKNKKENIEQLIKDLTILKNISENNIINLDVDSIYRIIELGKKFKINIETINKDIECSYIKTFKGEIKNIEIKGNLPENINFKDLKLKYIKEKYPFDHQSYKIIEIRLFSCLGVK
jgi:hypothetical protein